MGPPTGNYNRAFYDPRNIDAEEEEEEMHQRQQQRVREAAIEKSNQKRLTIQKVCTL